MISVDSAGALENLGMLTARAMQCPDCDGIVHVAARGSVWLEHNLTCPAIRDGVPQEVTVTFGKVGDDVISSCECPQCRG